MVLNGLTKPARKALTETFGPAHPPDAALNGPPARDVLKAVTVKRSLVKYLKGKSDRVRREIQKWDRDLAMETFDAKQMHVPPPSASPNVTAPPIA